MPKSNYHRGYCCKEICDSRSTRKKKKQAWLVSCTTLLSTGATLHHLEVCHSWKNKNISSFGPSLITHLRHNVSADLRLHHQLWLGHSFLLHYQHIGRAWLQYQDQCRILQILEPCFYLGLQFHLFCNIQLEQKVSGRRHGKCQFFYPSRFFQYFYLPQSA